MYVESTSSGSGVPSSGSMGPMFDDLQARLDRLHSGFVDGAEAVGYTRDSMRLIRPFWEHVEQSGDTPMIDSGTAYLKSVVFTVEQLETETKGSFDLTRGLARSATTFGSTSVATASVANPEMNLSVPPYQPVLVTPDRTDEYAAKLAQVDPPLGNTYRATSQILYGTRADPERGALWEMRQSFDHFFDKLAPDEEVRNSKFWSPKSGDNPNQVTREERIQYAASRHVADKNEAKRLAAASEQMVHTHQKLNQAHKRGELDSEKANKALVAMQLLLEDWADAIGLE